MDAEDPRDANEKRTTTVENDVASPGDQEKPTDTWRLPKALRQLQSVEIWLDRKLRIETQGVNRLTESEKRPPSVWNIFLIWASLNVHVGTLPFGVLGAQFGLSFHANVAACMVGIVVGSLFSAFNATLGPKTGLRQVACARFSFGIWGTRLCSGLNVITCGCFIVILLIVVGDLLTAVSDYTMSVTVGIVIIAVLSYVISFFGYARIHTFEKYSWIGTFVLFCVLVGQAAPHTNLASPSVGDNDLAIVGAFLTTVAVTMSYGVGWSAIASDYLVNYPADIGRWKVFGLVYAGLVIFTTFPVVVGAVLGNVAFANPESNLSQEYAIHGLGGLLRETYHPLGWSKFSIVLLALSALGNGTANSYSAGLCLQLQGEYFRAVPRFLWSLAFMVVSTVIAVAGRNHLLAITQNFVSVIGYWILSFAIVLLLEDQVFRRRRGYVLKEWNSPRDLPWGVAATLALVAGYLAGGLPGMAQTWYVGPIAEKFGPYGGDVGMYLVAAITSVVFLAGRPLERSLTGR